MIIATGLLTIGGILLGACAYPRIWHTLERLRQICFVCGVALLVAGARMIL